MFPSTGIADERAASPTEVTATAAETLGRSAGAGWSHEDVARRDRARSDEELVVAFARGDLQAFASLCQRLAGLVAHNAYRLFGPEAHPQDVVEATFLDVRRDAARFDPAEGSAQLWVLTLLHQNAELPARFEQRRPALIDDTE